MNEAARVFAGGIAGATAMAVTSRAAKLHVMSELEALAGSMVAPPRSAASKAAGVGMQLVNGGLLAQLYRPVFQLTGLQPGWRTGFGVGVLHGILAGAFMSAVEPLHPHVPEHLPEPGSFMLNRGVRVAVAFVALHGLFGAIVGAACVDLRSR
jgi:hypothetical protein